MAARKRKSEPPVLLDDAYFEAVAAQQTADSASLNELRIKSCVLLAEALDDPTPLSDSAMAVEAALFEAHEPGSSAYRAAVRTLLLHLRRNSALRASVISGALSPAELVSSSADELLTADQRHAKRAVAESSLRRTIREESQDAVATSAYACPACGKREALLLRVYGTRDIGKSETWGSKDAGESKACRLSCVACRHEWKSET
jgi:hypothetical protein